MEHKLILGGEQFLPFARSRIKALRAAGLQHASQQFEIEGVSIKVRIEGEHEYIRLEGGCTSHGFLLTRGTPEVVQGVMREVYFGSFPGWKKHAGGNFGGTHRITPTVNLQTGEAEPTDPPSPAAGLPISPTVTAVGPNQRWPSLYSGYMRLIAQHAQAAATGNLFDFRFSRTHGAFLERGTSGNILAVWIVEVSDGIYAAKLPPGACFPQAVASFMNKYKPAASELGYLASSGGLISLSYVFATRENSGVRRLRQNVPVSGAPLSEQRGWAFNYSGNEAQCVTFSTPSSTPEYRVDRTKIAITAEGGAPVSASISTVEVVTSFVNDTSMLIWFPTDDPALPFNYEQLDVAGTKVGNPATRNAATPIDVYYQGDAEQVSRLGQSTPSSSSSTTYTGCNSDWIAGTYAADPDKYSGSSQQVVSSITGGAESFSTPAGTALVLIGELTTTDKTFTVTPAESWFASVLGSFGKWERYGWAVRMDATTEDQYTGKGAIVLSYFDRESVLVVDQTTKTTNKDSTSTWAWTFTDNVDDPLSLIPGYPDHEGPPRRMDPPLGYDVRSACTTFAGGRFTSLGGYNAGSDPAPVVTSSTETHTTFNIFGHVGGVAVGGAVLPSESSAADKYLEYRNISIGQSIYQPATIWCAASAAANIEIPNPTDRETNIVGTRIAATKTAYGPGDVYSGDVLAPDPAGSYLGFVGNI